MSSSLIDLLGEQILSGGLSQIAGQLGTDEDTARQAVPAALGTLMGGLARNASRPAGVDALFGALERDHDGSVLDDLHGAIRGADAGPGAGILRHVFGGQGRQVESGLGQATNLNSGQAAQLLKLLAPLVLGALGKAQRQGALDSRGLAGMLDRERATVSRHVPRGHGLGSLIDRDGDGQIADDLVEQVGSGLLKKLFG